MAHLFSLGDFTFMDIIERQQAETRIRIRRTQAEAFESFDSQDSARAGSSGEQVRSRRICERFDLPDFIMDFTSLMPNKSPEPTAVGACRSAIAVHVASRRWLSFLR